jgi:hypothetical protein
MRRALAVVSLLCGGGSVASADTTIGFDNLAGLAVVSDQYRAQGVVFEGNWQVQSPSPFTNPVSGPNSVAFFDPLSQQNNYAVAAHFVVPGTSIPATTHTVSFTPTDANLNDTLLTIRGYNSAGFEIANATRFVDGLGVYDPGVDAPLTVTAPVGQAIAMVELSVARSDGGGRVIEGDDFHFGTLVVPPCGPADVGSTGASPGPDHVLDNNDFIVFIDLFFANDPSADRGSTGAVPGADGTFDNNDFIVFIDQFFAGC